MIKFRSLAPALLALALGLIATLIVATMVHREVTRMEQRQFQTEAEAVTDAIAGSMRSYELALGAGAALFQTVGEVSDGQWHTFVSSLRLSSAYPGYQGLGFAQVVRREDIADLERRQQAAGHSEFRVRPDDGADYRVPIVKLEPRDWRNQRALGFDMFSEAIRRAAMERARDTGLPSLSGKVVLVQETGESVQAGVLMYLPVYSGEPPLASLQERRERLRGFVYMAMRMDDLMRAVLQRHTPAALSMFDITVHDADKRTEEAQLFHSVPAATSSLQSHLYFERPLEVGGRTWTLSISAAEPVVAMSDKSRPWIVLGAGLIISGLIGAIGAFQAVARAHLALSRAALAEEVVERKKAQEAADMANSELIHRVKNTLAVVSAIASQTSRYSASVQEFDLAFRERLAALGRVQDLVRPGAEVQPDLTLLIEQLLAPYIGGGNERLIVSGPPVTVPKNDIVLLSLAFNELATNAIKYGAWSIPAGQVAIDWSIVEEEGGQRALHLTWREAGRGSMASERQHGTATLEKQGFGTAVLKFAIERAMNGRLLLDDAPGGVVYHMRIPQRT